MSVINDKQGLFTHNLQKKKNSDPILYPDSYKQVFMRFRIRQKILQIRPDPYQQQW